MTKFYIRSSEALGTPNVYGWSEAEYDTPLAAAWALAGLPERTVHFYQLEVRPVPSLRSLSLPGHDPMF